MTKNRNCLILDMKEQNYSMVPWALPGTAAEAQGDRKILPDGRKKGTYGQHQ